FHQAVEPADARKREENPDKKMERLNPIGHKRISKRLEHQRREAFQDAVVPFSWFKKLIDLKCQCTVNLQVALLIEPYGRQYLLLGVKCPIKGYPIFFIDRFRWWEDLG